jgi:ABC-type sugar transport system ATPase subunit
MTVQTLEVRSVTKRFGSHTALNSVSFTVARGEVVALLGDNGAGKSTLVKCIAGLHTPDDGEILIEGMRRSGDSFSHLRLDGVGVVYQDLALFDNLSVAENLFAGAEPRWPAWAGPLGFVDKRRMTDEASSTFRRLEVRIPNLNTPVGLLSGGQRQAIAVSKAIAFARTLVILDEPTAALGLRERTNVLRLVKQLPKQGMAVVIISHNLDEVIAVADRCVVLRQGQMVGEVAAEEANREKIVSLIVGGRLSPSQYRLSPSAIITKPLENQAVAIVHRLSASAYIRYYLHSKMHMEVHSENGATAQQALRPHREGAHQNRTARRWRRALSRPEGHRHPVMGVHVDARRQAHSDGAWRLSRRVACDGSGEGRGLPQGRCGWPRSPRREPKGGGADLR